MKTQTIQTVLLATLLVLISGCGWGVDGVDRMEDLYPKDAGADTGADVIGDSIEQDADFDTVSDTSVEDIIDAANWPDVSYEGIEGSWAVRLVSKANMNVVVDETEMSTSDLFIAESTAEGLTLTFCDEIIDVVPTDMFSTTTTTKPALREAIAQTTLELATTGTSVDSQLIVWRWALGESIGDDDDFSGLEVNTNNFPDLDGDEHEGVTISVEFTLGPTTVGERYMAKRAKFNLGQGEMSADGRWITGDMTFIVDEKVLGADEDMLKMGATITPIDEGSGYQMRRVDSEFDCETLVANHKALFEQAP